MPEETKSKSRKASKPSPSPEQKTTKPEIKCYKCGKPGHRSFSCAKGRGKPSQGYLLSVTTLTTEQSEFPPCNVEGKTNGKFAEMVVDSGCTSTLIHSKFVKSSALTGEKIAVLTATPNVLQFPLQMLNLIARKVNM